MIDGAPLDVVPNDPGLRLRPAGPADEPFIRHLFEEVRTAQFAAAGLSGPMLEHVIAQQFRSQTAGYAAQFPDAISLIIMQNAAAIGRLLLHCTREHWHIIDIALLSADCGHGFGAQIINALEASARQRDVEALTLSVLASNLAARRFYLRHGFVEIEAAGAAHLAMKKILAI
jgi:ribosomal protein S18 acetylase RimI-like enzyme